MNRVYLDNNATTRLDPAVLEAMLPWLTDRFGNPSSIHGPAREARAAVHAARRPLADAIGADQDEILFTATGTEAANLAVLGIARAGRERGDHVITSAVEHPAVLEAVDLLEAEGFRVTRLPVDAHGAVAVDDVERAIDDATILVSIMAANNEVGTLQPVEAIGELARERGVPFHSDAVQRFGKAPLDVATLHVDALSVSAHKIHGPKGIGALYLRRGTPWTRVLAGGEQEGGRRPGTENVAAIVGFATAASLACASDAVLHRERIEGLASDFLAALRDRIDGVELNGPATNRLANTLNVSFAGTDAESLAINLDLEGVSVSSGSACSSGSVEISHVLRAMRLEESRARSALRFSLSRETTRDELLHVVDVIEASVARIRTSRTSSGAEAGTPKPPK